RTPESLGRVARKEKFLAWTNALAMLFNVALQVVQ
ncbi:MAG: hypothetical protein RJB10_1079, partial [Pseudomonadota bacterium]